MSGVVNGGVCVVAGVGPGTGLACVERFARQGYRVAMLARNEGRLKEWAERIPNTSGFPCDLTDRASVDATFAKIGEQLGPVSVLVYNAAMGAFSEFMDLDPQTLERNFQTNTMGLLHCGQLAAADMLAEGAGSIVITGNTSARRGKASFAGFAPTKAAQRILGESMARSLGPKGIHVGSLVIDPVIDQIARDTKLLEELGLKLVYTMDTHAHADHITASGLLRQRLGSKAVVGADAGAVCADIPVTDGATRQVGGVQFRVRATAGRARR